MSNRYLDAAWKVIGGLSTAEKIILIRLADRADANGKSFAGRASISRECCVDRRTVSRAFKRLTALGYLERQPTGAGAKGYGTSVSFLTSKIFDATSDEPSEQSASEPDVQPDESGDPAPEPETSADVIPHPTLELVPEEPVTEQVDHFEDAWQQFPRRKGIRSGKKKSREIYDRIIKRGDATHTEILSGILRYASYCDQTGALAKDMSTWLNGAHWNDEIEPSETSQQIPSSRMTADQARNQRTDQAIRDTWQKLQTEKESARSAPNLIPKGN